MTPPVPVALPTPAPPRPPEDESLTTQLLTDLYQIMAIIERAEYYRTGSGRVAYTNLLHHMRVALTNPGSRQARSLVRAVARFDALVQVVVPDPELGGVPASGRPCNLAAVHNPANCLSPGCTGGRRAA